MTTDKARLHAKAMLNDLRLHLPPMSLPSRDERDIETLLAERYVRVHEEGREEMSDAIAELMQRHLCVESLFGWEARILSLAVDILRRERLARVEGAKAMRDAAAKLTADQYARWLADPTIAGGTERALTAFAETADAIRAINPAAVLAEKERK